MFGEQLTQSVDSQLRHPYAIRIEGVHKIMNKETKEKKLEYLRQQIRNENISYGEIAELQGLVKYIDENDIELLEWIENTKI